MTGPETMTDAEFDARMRRACRLHGMLADRPDAMTIAELRELLEITTVEATCRDIARIALDRLEGVAASASTPPG